jgi:hypothetical protein
MAPCHARGLDLEEGDVLSQRLLDEDLKQAIHLMKSSNGRSLWEAATPGELMHLH